MSTMIDTPEGIAFFRALARQGAVKLGKPGIVKVLREVYGYPGGPKAVKQMHAEFVEGSLTIREWAPGYGQHIADIVNEATTRAAGGCEACQRGDPDTHAEHVAKGKAQPAVYTKDVIDGNIQALFSAGAITEQEGNDACLLLFVEVIRRHAGSR